MFEKKIAAYRKGDRRTRHSILMKWSLLGLLAAELGFYLENELGWSFGGALALVAALGIIVLVIAGLVNLTSDKESVAYLGESWRWDRITIQLKWALISFGVALAGSRLASLGWPVGKTVLLIGILLGIFFSWKNIWSSL